MVSSERKSSISVSRSGKTIREGIKFIGGDPAKLATVKRSKGSIKAYLELHIEQGGTLDAEKIDIGIVEGIRRHQLVGRDYRRLCQSCGHDRNEQSPGRFAGRREIHRSGKSCGHQRPWSTGGHRSGRIQALPGAPNVIPGKVVLSLELRDLEARKIDMLFQKIRGEADQIAQSNKVTFDFKQINVNIPRPPTRAFARSSTVRRKNSAFRLRSCRVAPVMMRRTWPGSRPSA
jgi:N-carbamoyl-L-amino-acid hydrolase